MLDARGADFDPCIGTGTYNMPLFTICVSGRIGDRDRGEHYPFLYRRRRPSSVARYRYYKRRDLNRDTAKRWLRQKEHSSRCFIMFSRTTHATNRDARTSVIASRDRDFTATGDCVRHACNFSHLDDALIQNTCLKQCFSQMFIQNRWRTLLEGFH